MAIRCWGTLIYFIDSTVIIFLMDRESQMIPLQKLLQEEKVTNDLFTIFTFKNPPIITRWTDNNLNPL